MPFGLQSLKYLLSGPLQDKFVLREPTVYQAVSQVLYTHYLILATTLWGFAYMYYRILGLLILP